MPIDQEIPNDLAIVEDPDMERCRRYVMYREEHPEATMGEISDVFGVARQTLYNRIAKWRRTGVLDRVRLMILIPKAEAINAAIDRVMEDWPLIILRQRDDALKGENAVTRNRSADWLLERIIKPALALQPPPDSEESEFLSNTNDNFTPTDIPGN